MELSSEIFADVKELSRLISRVTVNMQSLLGTRTNFTDMLTFNNDVDYSTDHAGDQIIVAVGDRAFPVDSGAALADLHYFCYTTLPNFQNRLEIHHLACLFLILI